VRCGHRRTRLVEDRGVPAPLAQPLEPNAAKYAVVAAIGTASPIWPELAYARPSLRQRLSLTKYRNQGGERGKRSVNHGQPPVSNAPALVASTSLDAILR